MSLEADKYLSGLQPQPVELDVGGTIYKTTIETLTSCPDGFFERLFSQTNWSSALQSSPLYSTGKALFIDRDGKIFYYILEYLRNGRHMVLPSCAEIRMKIRAEASAYGIVALTDLIDGVVTLRFVDRQSNGRNVTLKLSDLRSEPDSKLGRAFSGDLKSLARDESGRFLMRRDNYDMACQVAEFLKNGQIENNRHKFYYRSDYVKYLKELRAEAEYFQIPLMIAKIEELIRQV